MYEYLNLIVNYHLHYLDPEGLSDYQRDLKHGLVEAEEHFEGGFLCGFDVDGCDFGYPSECDMHCVLGSYHSLLSGLNLFYDHLGSQKWSLVSQSLFSEEIIKVDGWFSARIINSKDERKSYAQKVINRSYMVTFQRNIHI